MRIGILTFHDGINYGAFMQVYSLQQAIESLGHSVEIINYKSPYHWLREYIHVLKKNKLFSKNIKKLLKFKALQKKYLNFGTFSFNINKISGSYDVIVFGSDEIWNVHNASFGHNYRYFGKKFPKNIKKVAYAPSCGSTPIGSKKLQPIITNLKSFSSIGVRDYNTRNIVQELISRKPKIVPDPTFLVDHQSYIITPKCTNYVLVYSDNLPHSEVVKIQNYANENKLRIVSVGFYHKWCDENYTSVDPFEWLGYIKNAKFVFTTMFHGTIFSILFNKQLKLMLDEYRINKFSYILKYFDIGDALYDESILIDYETINPKIKLFKEKGISYLKESIQGTS